MARSEYQLSVGNPQLTVSLERFSAAWVYLDNPTASWVYMHRGGTSIPSALNADFAIQPGTAKVLTVGGKDFALLLANPTAIPSTQTAGLAGASVTVVFGDNTETPPAIGSLNYNSLGMSDLLPGTASWVTGATPTLYGPFDLETWGGLIVFINQSSIAPASISVQYSDNAVTWYTAQTYALFQNLATTIIFPRANRYARIALGSPATGVGATGTIQVRAVQEVITQAHYSTTSSGASSALYTVLNGNSQSQTIYTQGIPGIQFLFDGVVSTGVINITVSGSQDGSAYHVMARYNLKCSQSAQQLWSIASPPPYLAVSVANQTGSTINAPLFFIPADPEPESGLYLLNQILGTPTDAVGAGTVYGQLQSIALNTTGPLVISNIGATTDVTNASGQGTVIAELHELLNALTQGGSLHGAVDTANATSLIGQLRQLVGITGAGGSAAGASTDGPQAVSNTASSILGQIKNLTAVMGYGGSVAAAVDAAGATSVIGQLRSIKADDDTIAANSTSIVTNTSNTASSTSSTATNTANILTQDTSIANTNSFIQSTTGLTTDPSGTNTIMGKLKAISTDTSTTATQTTAINTNSSTIATQTTAINSNTSASASSLVSIASAAGTTSDAPSATTIIGYLNNIADILAYGASAKPTLDTSAGASLLASMRQTAAILGQIGNASAPDGAGTTSILGQIKSVKLDADAISTNTSSLVTNTTPRGASSNIGVTAVGAGVWTTTGSTVTASSFITSIVLSHSLFVGAATAVVQLSIGYGTAGAVTNFLANALVMTGQPFVFSWPSWTVKGAGGVGANNTIWVFASAACSIGWSVGFTA